MHIALWIVQVLLAAAFLMFGASKAFTPLPELAASMAWVAAVPGWVTRLAGFAEIAGALGLVLPALTRIQPRLTPLAAAGLMTVMLLAAGLHLSRGEFAMLPFNATLFALAGFVAWGRTRKVPIAARASANPAATRELPRQHTPAGAGA